MSFNSANLKTVVWDNASAVHYYTTTDTIADVQGSNYFNGALPGIRQGDAILVAASDHTCLGQFTTANTATDNGNTALSACFARMIQIS